MTAPALDDGPTTDLLAQLTYVIPVRIGDPQRARNLSAVTAWIAKELPLARVLVVEQDAAPTMRVERAGSGGLGHLFVEDGGPFDKGWLVNCGARRSDRPLLACGDADVVVSRAQFLAALRLLATFDAVKPFHRSEVLELDEHASARFARTLDVTGARGMSARQMTNFAGGLFLARRASFLGMGGFPEGFAGWGGEDDALGILLESLLSCAEIPGPALHLAHPRGLASSHHAGYAANLDRLLAIAALSPAELATWNARRRDAAGDVTRPAGARWVAP